MDDSDFLAKCFSLGMISKDKRVAISEVTASRRRKEELLSTISTTAKNFVKFREILRTDSIERYADYMDDLDSVGPDPTGQSIPNIPYLLQLCIEMLFLLDRETAQQNVIKLILLSRVDLSGLQENLKRHVKGLNDALCQFGGSILKSSGHHQEAVEIRRVFLLEIIRKI